MRSPALAACARILDGYAAGKTATSNAYGAYRIDRVLTEETFTIEASKEGYATTRVTFRIDPASFLDIKLTPLSS